MERLEDKEFQVLISSQLWNPEGPIWTSLIEMGWSLISQGRTLPHQDNSPAPNQSVTMNVIVWNCRGALRPNFVSYVMDLVREFDPTILIVTETKVGGSRAKEITDRLPFDGAFHADTVGYAGGIWVLWNSDAVEITQLASTEQEIHGLVKVNSSGLSWIISAIYASPRLSERRMLWHNLKLVNDLHNLPWIMLGDFNEVLSSVEKLGGRPVNAYRAGLFQECLNACGMMDMGFVGSNFTWTNLRNFSDLIQERLDRGFCNVGWRFLYPEASIEHLVRVNSDHCPILLNLEKPLGLGLVRPFRFQPGWLSHPGFPSIVRNAWRDNQDLDIAVTSFTASARRWNKEVFGNLFGRRKRIEARLKGVQKALAERPSESLLELDRTLRLEHGEVKELINEFWAMKSRLNWLVSGERNTTFFHASVLNRRRRNRITRLSDNVGNLIVDEREVAEYIRRWYVNMYTTEMGESQRRSWDIPNWQVKLSEEEGQVLASPVTDQEIKDGLWALKSFKAPGPDGLHAGFYQRFWLLTGKSVIETVRKVFETGAVPAFLNTTLITLIPKHSGAITLGSYRPISLCNTIYKIISKVIVARLRPYLGKIISPMQAAFVPGRKGVDHAIIVQELLHSLSLKKGKRGFMAVKIDLEKAYDRIEWSFVRDTLALFNIPPGLSKVIMSCISTSSIEVLFNGGALAAFNPSRGIRQGDPLSPYIFIMCMEVLGFLIRDKCDSNLWDPVSASRGGLAFSHLFFADDLVLFGRADRKNCLSMMDTLDCFCSISGQKINKDKSRIYFSPNIDAGKREELCGIMGMRSTPNLGKYLGFPLKQPGSSSQDYNFVIERVQAKLAGWKGNLLSFAGRIVLAQSVLTTVPSYTMQNVMLPNRVLASLDRVARNFIWGSTLDKRKLHMVSWSTITKAKKEGGLGLQAAKPKNLALMAKLNWRYKMEKDKDWARVLSNKYRNPNRSGSCVWRGMKQGNAILEKGIKWIAGSDCKLSFWFDKWMDIGNIRSLIEGPLRREEDKWMVRDVRVGERWDFSRFSFVFPDKILRLLRAVPFPSSHWCEDKVVWGYSPSGEFDQKTAYAIARGDSGLAAKFEGEWVWKVDSMPRIICFLWKLCHRSIPVKEVLYGRGITQDAQCCVCNNERESIIHAIRDCSFAKSVWDNFSTASDIPGFYNLDLCPWLKINLNFQSLRSDLMPWKVLFSFVVWNLWVHRNNVAFKGVRLNQNLWSHIKHAATEFLFCAGKTGRAVTREARSVRWLRPSPGWVRLNTDGSSLGNPGKAGGGGLIRDENGSWIKGFIRNIGFSSSMEAELWALRDGLSLCLSLNIYAVEVEIDAKVVCGWITNSSSSNLNLSPLIVDCRTLLSRIPQVKLNHCYREANQCADALAKKGSVYQQDFMIFDSPPVDISMLLYYDSISMYFERTSPPTSFPS
ncbi:hypothetical protein SO802_012927 [Lithocarpus litseifolius]|uniref:Reverse transcriptase domain-containing protein n=1 Tax=Lithocarpus litseifolius TaxID=425828 RepID=A0AAW2D4V8_9ROSI